MDYVFDANGMLIMAYFNDRISGTDTWDTHVLFEHAADRIHTLCSSAQ